MQRQIKIVITDSQELFRSGLRNLFHEYPQFEIIAEASTPLELLRILLKLDPDIVLMDSELPNSESKKLLNKISKKYPDIKVIIVGIQTKSEVIYEFVILGAKAYLSRHLEAEEFIKMVNLVYERGQAIDDIILEMLLKQNTDKTISTKGKSWLTIKEKEVFLELKVGKKEAKIAELLNVSQSTIHTHKKTCLAKQTPIRLPN